MPRILPCLATVSAMLLAGASGASEHRFTLDLRGLDLASPEGADRAAARLARALDDYCGPADIPQPMAVARERATCRNAMHVHGREQIAQAHARAIVDAAPIEQARAAPQPANM